MSRSATAIRTTSCAKGCHAVEVAHEAGRVDEAALPLRRVTNALLMEAYVAECQKSVDRWNDTLEHAGLEERIALPSSRFNRKIGPFAGLSFDPRGEWQDDSDTTTRDLPSEADCAYLASLQSSAVLSAGRCAQWIAPPSHPINRQPLDFEYVRFA